MNTVSQVGMKDYIQMNCGVRAVVDSRDWKAVSQRRTSTQNALHHPVTAHVNMIRF